MTIPIELFHEVVQEIVARFGEDAPADAYEQAFLERIDRRPEHDASRDRSTKLGTVALIDDLDDTGWVAPDHEDCLAIHAHYRDGDLQTDDEFRIFYRMAQVHKLIRLDLMTQI